MAEVAAGNESDNDSRTAAFSAAAKSNATSTANSSPRSTSTKRSRRGKKRAQDARDFVPMGGTFSQSAEFLEPANSERSSSVYEPLRAEQSASDDMEVDLGKNRLATGFRSKSTSTSAVPPAPLNEENRTCHARDDNAPKPGPIEILSSDESMAESDDDGGMIVNLDESDGQVEEEEEEEEEEDHIIADSPDEGEVSPSPAAPEPISTDATTVVLASSKLKLEDLSAEDLETQVKYALFNLDRSQIDLNRPVTCLACLQTGHLAATCPELNCQHCNAPHTTRQCPRLARCSVCRQQGHQKDACSSDLRVTTVPCDICGTLSHTEESCQQRFFPRTSLQSLNGGPVRLWVSCCICASKSHLVGDCPDADRSAASRWSLKSLAPEELVNMSLESGAKSREIEAENRNMRPAGLQIRGRAGLHNTGRGPSASASDDEDDFLRPSVHRGKEGKPQPQIRVGLPSNRPNQTDRYDGYDASNGRDGRAGWYATDSFGRRRSRSPRAPGTDQWRPNDRQRPSPRRFDGRSQARTRSPSRGLTSIDSYRPDTRLPPNPANKPPSGHPQASRNVAQQPVALPTRKGSNPNLASKTGQLKQGQAKKQNGAGGNAGDGGGGGGSKKRGRKGNANKS